VRNPIAAFAAMMTLLDDDIGELLQLLKTLDIDDNTLVLLTTDNGPHLEGGHDPRFFDSNGPFKGFKRDLYEGGIRVPLLARWPGVIKAGSGSDLPSAHWDMLPTFCELAGVTPPGDIDGISIVPTLTGKGTQKRHDFLYWEFSPRGGKQAVRRGRCARAFAAGLNLSPHKLESQLLRAVSTEGLELPSARTATRPSSSTTSTPTSAKRTTSRRSTPTSSSRRRR